MKCADHDIEATDACSVCGRAMCTQCPTQGFVQTSQGKGTPTRCQKCTVDQLMVPTRRQVDAHAGMTLAKILAVLLALGLLVAAGCNACQHVLSEAIHT